MMYDGVKTRRESERVFTGESGRGVRANEARTTAVEQHLNVSFHALFVVKVNKPSEFQGNCMHVQSKRGKKVEDGG